MKSLRESQKGNFAERFAFYLKAPWVFEKWQEKAMLIILCLLGLWKILNFLT